MVFRCLQTFEALSEIAAELVIDEPARSETKPGAEIRAQS